MYCHEAVNGAVDWRGGKRAKEWVSRERPEAYVFLLHAFDVNNFSETDAKSIRFRQMSENLLVCVLIQKLSEACWFAFLYRNSRFVQFDLMRAMFSRCTSNSPLCVHLVLWMFLKDVG